MSKALIILIVFSMWMRAQCYDDGKYKPQKYNLNDDGRYYRPLGEGKYIPGDEGKYTYIYVQDIDGNYRYVHQEGPNGGNGGFGKDGRGGSNGRGGPNGPKGPPGPINDYIGNRIYAERYPYIHKFIKALIEKYVSPSYINYGDTPEGSMNHYTKVFADKEVAVKCHYLLPEGNKTEFITQYPQEVQLSDGTKLGSHYTFKGTKNLGTVNNALKNKLKLEYEVYVRIVDDVNV